MTRIAAALVAWLLSAPSYGLDVVTIEELKGEVMRLAEAAMKTPRCSSAFLVLTGMTPEQAAKDKVLVWISAIPGNGTGDVMGRSLMATRTERGRIVLSDRYLAQFGERTMAKVLVHEIAHHAISESKSLPSLDEGSQEILTQSLAWMCFNP